MSLSGVIVIFYLNNEIKSHDLAFCVLSKCTSVLNAICRLSVIPGYMDPLLFTGLLWIRMIP